MKQLSTADVEQKLTSFVLKEKQFTAFDVTKALRDDGFKAFHSDVRDVTHYFMENSETSPPYMKTLVEVDEGRGLSAFVYHPVGEDPFSYGKVTSAVPPVPVMTSTVPSVPVMTTTQTAPATPVTKATTATPTTSTITAQDSVLVIIDDQKSGRSVDGRGTFCVPNSAVVKLGLKRGDKVFAFKVNNVRGNPSVALTRNTDGKHLAKYTVDKSSNVRVTRKTMMEAGMACKPVVSFYFC